MRSRVLFLVVLTSATACGHRRARAPAQPAPRRPAAAPVAPAEPPDVALAREATAAWEKRADPSEIERALEAWRGVLARRPGDVGVLLAIARGEAARARTRRPSADAALAWAEGARAAEQALLATAPGLAQELARGAGTELASTSLPSEAVEPAYWYAVDLAGYALAEGLTAILHLGRRVEALLTLVAARDEALDGAGAHRALGTLYARAPAAAGGDLAKARAHFERAIAVAPGCLANALAFAEEYAVAAQDRTLFARLVADVAAAGDGPRGPGAEDAIDRAILVERARALSARAGALF